MVKKNKLKTQKSGGPQLTRKVGIAPINRKTIWLLCLIALGITAICFSPMLKNGFTNWDDDFYVIQNMLLRGPDWKGIFTMPVVANYHPLTVASLAINYQLTELDPSSYLLFNFILHLANTGLVFYFIFLLSDKKIWVGFFVALVFGIHPMHVESVAWIAERKDVLYTLFFLISLIQYWKYLQSGSRAGYWFCFLFFLLSLLSKPAAVILPLLLFLLDYWKSRPFKKAVVLEKIPFLILSVIFGIITLRIQSSTAITNLDTFPLWIRPFFSCYTLMIYFLRFFSPHPLSAFHPYPNIDEARVVIYSSAAFVIALMIATWLLRKNKFFVFGILFYLINLLLVLQVITVGSTIVSERYTYMPYIGLAFVAGMWLNSLIKQGLLKWMLLAGIGLIFGYISFQRTQVWKNSETLWTDAIEQYPDATVPRNQRAIYYAQQAETTTNKDRAKELFQKALADCNVALRTKPDYIFALENRQRICLILNLDKEALTDAETLNKLDPENYLPYYTRGMVYARMNETAKAVPELRKCISLKPNLDYVLNLLGSILVNNYQQYPEALAHFNHAILINPDGIYFMNRSVCYFKMGEMAKAKADAETAIQKGIAVPEDYRRGLNIK
jgi:hypothetical protein